MPTSSKAKKFLISALPKDAPGPIYELGSGWGSLAFPLAKRYPKISVTCYETSLFPYLFSKLRHYFDPLPNLKFIRQDFFQIPLPKESLVICYLYPGAMRRLKIKFEEELSPKALIVSNTFAIPGWRPISTIKVPDLYATNIYLYRSEFKN